VTKGEGAVGTEWWVLLEQIFIAALDTGETKLAKTCLDTLQAKFPKSRRIERLKGLQQEANHQFDAAIATYTKLLGDDPTDMLTLKRKACVYESKGDTKLAIALFVEYLHVFMNDYEAWIHLADLYLQEQMYQQALFCYEELILGSPTSFHYYIKAAELKYTLNTGSDDMLDAVKYYSYAVELSQTTSGPGDLRALMGLSLACKAVAESYKASLTPEMVTVAEWAKGQVLELYRRKGVSDEIVSFVGIA